MGREIMPLTVVTVLETLTARGVRYTESYYAEDGGEAACLVQVERPIPDDLVPALRAVDMRESAYGWGQTYRASETPSPRPEPTCAGLPSLLDEEARG